jgi:hypothetical protein
MVLAFPDVLEAAADAIGAGTSGGYPHSRSRSNLSRLHNELYYVVLTAWVVSLVASPLWLASFRYGPLERLLQEPVALPALEIATEPESAT